MNDIDVRAAVEDDSDVAARMLLTCAAPAGHEGVYARVQAVGARQALDEIANESSPLRGADGWRPRLRGLVVEQMRAQLAELGGRVVVPGDLEWSTRLDDLAVPPLLLWVRGQADVRFVALRSVAIVGARACTTYGQHVATSLSFELGELGWSTVSGGAYGIDAAAHKGCLAADAPTIAVLACGVNEAYPTGHAGMFERIAANGALVSEVPLGAHPTRFGFRIRNRVIAALAPAVVVVEAAAGSGSLITAREAAPIGRPVLVVPGPVTSTMSMGAMRACIDVEKAVDAIPLKQRQPVDERGRWRFVLNASDIVEAATPDLHDTNEALDAETKRDAEQARPVGVAAADKPPQPYRPDDPRQAQVMEALSALATPVDVLAVACGLTPTVALSALGQLAVGAHAVRDSGGWRLSDEQIQARGLRRPRARRGGP